MLFSVKAYSYKVNIYKYEWDAVNIFVNENSGIEKSDIERYFYLYDFWKYDFSICYDENFIFTRDINDDDFLQNLTNRIKKNKEELKNFDNFPSSLKDLKPIIENQKRAIEFGIWLQEIRLEFFTTWNANVLRKSYLGVPPSREILDIVNQIVILKNDIEIYDKPFANFQHAWCNYHLFVYEKLYNEKNMNEYGMQDIWNAFEKKYHITRTYEDNACD